jgi:hypothetical protein
MENKYKPCTNQCCEPIRLPIMSNCNCINYVACVQDSCGCQQGPNNSYNSSNTHITHNYMPRPVSNQGCYNGYYAAVAPVTYRDCNCAPQTNCSCQSSYGESSDCGCSGSGGNSTTGNVPANAPIAPYILASKLAPGKYMVTEADNVANGTLFVGTTNTAKTVGTEFTITVPTDIFYNVTAVSSLATVIRLTKI